MSVFQAMMIVMAGGLALLAVSLSPLCLVLLVWRRKSGERRFKLDALTQIVAINEHAAYLMAVGQSRLGRYGNFIEHQPEHDYRDPLHWD